ncbi:MAG: MATE family efflux transporter [Muribaculaceae bacterium]|nr:MATE family efflux transporter [Muribaculaceae bacterium]
MNRLNELETAPVGRLLWKYSVPSVVGIVVMSIYNVIDRIFIGQGVGADAIAGLAITFPVMNISSAFGVLVGVGASSRISVVLGMGDKPQAKQILGNSIVLTLVFGTFYILVLGLLLDPILRLFGASDTSLPYAHDFMFYLLPGLLINNLCYSYNNVMRATGYPTKAMITMFIGAGLNVILAPIFIFGLDWGIKGAAIATDISMGISALFVMIHFFNPKSEIHFTQGTYHLQRRIIMPVLAIGAAPCIVNTAGCVVNGIINNTIYHYGGDSAVAAMGIFVTFTQLIITFIIGVCMGMQPIVGYNFGARRYDRLKRTFWLAAAVCTAASVVCTLMGQLTPSLIARPFTSDHALIQATDHALRLTTIMFWCAGFQIVVTNFFQAIGEVSKSIFMSLSRQVLFLIPCLLILPEFLQLKGVWLSFPLADILSFIVATVLIVKVFRKINRLIQTTPHR